ncbi:MAG: hypothetical protein ACREVK_13185 [Gammaproteobacteria bacterium]
MGGPNNRPNIKDELARMGGEPLLPVEKKLVGWSLILGAILLVVLVWISYTFFPAAG